VCSFVKQEKDSCVKDKTKKIKPKYKHLKRLERAVKSEDCNTNTD
jgi:hypothetical protein